MSEQQRTRPTQARIEPAEESPPQVSGEMQSARRGIALNITRTVARHPALLQRFGPLGRYLAIDGTLDPREREIVILRMGWRARSVYEFGQHTIFGRGAGLSDEEITAVTADPSAWPGADHERDLIAMVDELYEDDCVGDPTWARLAARYSEAELIELVMLAGFYRTVSGFLNTMGVQLEEGVPGWPDGVEP